MGKLSKYIKRPSNIILYLSNKSFFKWIPDRIYLKIKYRLIIGKPLNLKNPQTLNEKLQWLKLYDRKDIYTTMVDKYEVKKYIASIIGDEYIIPTLGIYDKFEDIDFEKLPNEFVLKPTHTSGNVFICKDKTKINYKKLKKEVNKWLKRKYYYCHREWPYKNVKPRIIAEKLLVNENGKEIFDYKFYGFNGKSDYVMFCTERHTTSGTKFYDYDRNWNLQRNMSEDGKKTDANFKVERPKNLQKMFEIAEILSKGIKFVRVDLYDIGDRVYFGEMTFYPSAGWDATRTQECDEILSKNLKLF